MQELPGIQHNTTGLPTSSPFMSPAPTPTPAPHREEIVKEEASPAKDVNITVKSSDYVVRPAVEDLLRLGYADLAAFHGFEVEIPGRLTVRYGEPCLSLLSPC